MSTRMATAFMLIMAILATSCTFQPLSPTPTPLPGWGHSISELFVDTTAFPEGWRIGAVRGDTTDPTVNHLAREWERTRIAGTVFQAIWRAYTTASAEDRYDDLRESQFDPIGTPHATDLFIPFEPPEEIHFQSQMADEFYQACGWRGTAYCEVIARYRNYVIEMRLEREASYEGHTTLGLTYTEIEAVVIAMDAKFAELMQELYPDSY